MLLSHFGDRMDGTVRDFFFFPGLLVGLHSQVLLLKSKLSQKGKSLGTILNHFEELDFPETS